MKVYAIRHKPTARWMPARMNKRQSAGWTYWEPGGEGGCGGWDKNPRIFFNEQSAKKALTCWLAGVVVNTASGSGKDPYDDPEYEIKAPLVKRVREDMEIVPLNLSGYDFELDALVNGR